ncbi:MAG: CBS domain-containing protein, partial [Saprospiraceae bacterium]|nr:CBS domain-containing protein [Saprospiraceae bacterium]
FMEPGAVIVLEMSKRDYSLSELSRIVESEHAKILSSYITTNLDSERIDVTIKINRQEISRILASFERFEYQVKASFQEGDFYDSLRDRYDSLITYLNV